MDRLNFGRISPTFRRLVETKAFVLPSSILQELLIPASATSARKKDRQGRGMYLSQRGGIWCGLFFVGIILANIGAHAAKAPKSIPAEWQQRIKEGKMMATEKEPQVWKAIIFESSR